MGRAASLLSRPRAIAFVAVAAGLVAYFYSADSIPRVSLWWEVLLLDAALLPAVFLLVWLVLPLATARGVWVPALVLGAVAVLAELGDLEVPANLAKLGAVTFFAFWFLNFFEELFLIVIVALIVPWVDAYSVFKGPTGNIVEHHSEIFRYLSFEFTLPHEPDDPRLGIPDLLFFALFLAAAARFRLRPGWTWLAMVLTLGGTIALAAWTDIGGLPALPALSLGFLAPNADLIWTRLRRRSGDGPEGPPPSHVD